MVLPATGTEISFNQIRIELGVSTQAPFGIRNAENDEYRIIQNCSTPFPSNVIPASISEWWSYDDTQRATLYATNLDRSLISCADACGLLPANSFSIYKYGPEAYADTGCRSTLTAGYYVDASRTTCYTISGNSISESSCTTTTTTTSTTTTTGTCDVYNYASVASLTSCATSQPDELSTNTGLSIGSRLYVTEPTSCQFALGAGFVQVGGVNYQTNSGGYIIDTFNVNC